MSYILDALKKSEKERQIGQVPTLHSVEAVEMAAVSKPFPILMVVIIVLLLVVVALLYFQPKKVETEIVVKNVEHEAVRVEKQSTVEKVAKAQDIMEVMAQEQKRKQQLVKREVTPAPVKTEVVSEQSDKILLKEGEILITPTSRIEALDSKEKAKEVITIPDDTSVPLLSETEYDFQAQLPEMHLDVHVYKDRKKDRFVLINMDKYREGQKMSNGTVIEAIVVDGVMMNYQGQRFLLPLN